MVDHNKYVRVCVKFIFPPNFMCITDEILKPPSKLYDSSINITRARSERLHKVCFGTLIN